MASTTMNTRIGNRWPWMVVAGCLLVICGIFAIANGALSPLVSVWTLAGLLIAVGVIEVAASFSVKEWGGFFAFFLTGILAAIAGILIFSNPLASGAGLTLVLGIVMVVDGTFAIVLSFSREYPNRGWTLFSGACALLLGSLVLFELPFSAPWLLGTYLGVRFIVSGIESIQISLLLRKPLAT